MNWEKHIKEHIDINKPFIERGFVYKDDTTNFVDNAKDLVIRVLEDGIPFKDAVILDFGCGTGRLPIGLDSLDTPIKEYVGVDVMQPSIDFLQEAFKDSAKHTFIHSQVKNTRYAKNQSGKFPDIPEKDYTLVFGWSVFTHLGKPENALYNLQRLSNLVGNGCLFYLTWFKSPPNSVSYSEKRSVYPQRKILEMYDKAGIYVLNTFGGDTVDNNNQWRIVGIKK